MEQNDLRNLFNLLQTGADVDTIWEVIGKLKEPCTDTEWMVSEKLRICSLTYAKPESYNKDIPKDENKFALARLCLAKGWRDGFAEACTLLGTTHREAINAYVQQKNINVSGMRRENNLDNHRRPEKDAV